MKLLPIIHEVKSRCRSHDSDDDDDEHDDQYDGSVADGGYDRETKLVYFRYAIVDRGLIFSYSIQDSAARQSQTIDVGK